MQEQMTKQDAIEYLLYLKHDVQAKSPMDIALDTAIEVLKQPTIEPEVRHGRWIPQGDDMWLCSNCKENVIFSIHESDRTEKQRYCCRCGARMDGGING